MRGRCCRVHSFGLACSGAREIEATKKRRMRVISAAPAAAPAEEQRERARDRQHLQPVKHDLRPGQPWFPLGRRALKLLGEQAARPHEGGREATRAPALGTNGNCLGWVCLGCVQQQQPPIDESALLVPATATATATDTAHRRLTQWLQLPRYVVRVMEKQRNNW